MKEYVEGFKEDSYCDLILQLGAEWFVEQLENMSEEEKIYGYSYVVSQFLFSALLKGYTSDKSGLLYLFNSLVVHLELRISGNHSASNLFDELSFWKKAFLLDNKILINFMKGVWWERAEKNLLNI